jgi:hypothetical protein
MDQLPIDEKLLKDPCISSYVRINIHWVGFDDILKVTQGAFGTHIFKRWNRIDPRWNSDRIYPTYIFL